jgi:16S rRNA (uracil1498-N3)-methyltransferase
MTRRRFYAPVDSFASDATVVRLGADETRHLRGVLRLKPGDEAHVFNGRGKEFRCVVGSVGRVSAQLSVIEEVEPFKPESPVNITLALALLKGDKFDLVIQKATELGVRAILPLVTKLADVKLRDEGDGDKKVTRWQRIALEAAKQSGRAFVPTVHDPTSIGSLVVSNPAEVLFFSERDGASLSTAFENNERANSSLLAVIGPEGGWADSELLLARTNGWAIVTLGGRILRAETAAIAMIAILQHLYGDLK